jgi:DNA gyrase subunit B
MELNTYLVNVALEGAELHVSAAAPAIQGQALAALADKLVRVMAVIERLGRRYDRRVLEQMIYAPVVTRERLDDRPWMTAWIADLEKALRSALNGEGATYRLSPLESEGNLAGIRIQRERHGMAEVNELSIRFFESPEYAQMAELGQNLIGLIGEGAFISRDKERQGIDSFRQAMEWLMEEARKGQTIQRYKGLGEMNPAQLWDTTVNPQTRRLMQVRIEDAVAADEIFTTLMGDQVEPRRDFIERNALTVANLDV